jgi:hypothetical protein
VLKKKEKKKKIIPSVTSEEEIGRRKKKEIKSIYKLKRIESIFGNYQVLEYQVDTNKKKL